LIILRSGGGYQAQYNRHGASLKLATVTDVMMRRPFGAAHLLK